MARSSHSLAAMAAWLAMAVLLLNAVAPVDAQDAPPEVRIEGVTFGGTGCNNDNTVYHLSADKKSIDFIFSDFAAILGEREESYCDIQLQLESTDGWILEKAETVGRGFADLGASVVGTHRLTTDISGLRLTSEPSKRTTVIVGPYTGNYEVNETFKVIVRPPFGLPGGQQRLPASGCLEPNAVNIKSSLKVEGPDGAKGIMEVDSQSTGLTIKCFWKSC